METTSIKEVARQAGVSLGTVSNVLNRPEVVAERTRQRVLDAIKELGYVRNDSARQLRAGRSRTVAIVVLERGQPVLHRRGPRGRGGDRGCRRRRGGLQQRRETRPGSGGTSTCSSSNGCRASSSRRSTVDATRS